MAPNRSAASIFFLLIFLSTTILATFALTASAHAEFVLSSYGGTINTMDADVRLSRPGGTDLTFSDVSWTDKSFEGPIYLWPSLELLVW